MLWFVNHEWRKHGTCGKETPDSYFEQICALSAPIVAKVNELSYTSSFGEYNPGGGKELVAKYLELARGETVLARDSLKTMIELLKI